MKPEPVLTHMPLHVQLKIAGFVDPVTKFSSLRLCSKHFKNIVDKSRTHYPSIDMHVFCKSFFVSLIVDETHKKQICFRSDGNETSYRKQSLIGKAVVEERKEGDNYLAALEHFAEVMSNPKISVGSFEAHFYTITHIQRFLIHCKSILRSYQNKFSVERFIITCPHRNTISPMISMFKPGFLRTIVFKRSDKEGPLYLNQVVKLEQWKKAVELDASGVLTKDDLPYSHFETLSLKLTHLSLRAVELIVQNFLNNSNTRSTSIVCNTADNDAILAYLGQFEKVGNGYFIPIPGSGDSLEVCFNQEPSFMFTVKRIKGN